LSLRRAHHSSGCPSLSPIPSLTLLSCIRYPLAHPTHRQPNQRTGNAKPPNLALLFFPALFNQTEPPEPLPFCFVHPPLLGQLEHRVPALELGIVDQSRLRNVRRRSTPSTAQHPGEGCMTLRRSWAVGPVERHSVTNRPAARGRRWMRTETWRRAQRLGVLTTYIGVICYTDNQRWTILGKKHHIRLKTYVPRTK
jgi:hypothetical protein